MRNFKVQDFEGSGQYLVRMGEDEIKKRKKGLIPGVESDSYLCTITYKVGYITNNYKIGGTRGQITCLTAMSDGHVTLGHYITKRKDGTNIGIADWKKILWVTDENSSNKQKFVDHLNDTDVNGAQEMRFATKEEIIRVVSYKFPRNGG